MAKTAKCRSKGAGSLVLRGRTWFARWSVDGKVFTRTTGLSNKREAEKKLAEFTAPFKMGSEEKTLETIAARLGGVQAEIQRYEDEKPALGILGAWTAYTNAPNRPDSGQRTMAGYASQFGRFTDWMKKNHPEVTELRGVTEEIAFQFASDLGKKYTPNTYNKYTVLFLRIWKVLHKTARLTCNPWENLESKLLATHSRRELTIEELTKVCGSVDGEMRLLFAIGLYCGLRLGDAVQLKWSNIDLVRNQLSVVPGKTERHSNGKVLQIPLHHSLHTMLTEAPKEKRKGYILPELAELYQRKKTKGALVVKRIRKVFESCGIETQCKVEGYSRMGVDVGFHSLRHSFVSLSANAGSSLAAVQAVVGHSNPAMTRHYLHADQNIVKNAVYALPDVTGITITEKTGKSTHANLDAILKQLEELDVEQLKELVKKTKATLKAKTV